MKQVLFSVSTLLMATIVCAADYEWRDYNGTVPDDAITGGYDGKGDEIFVGKVTIRNGVTVVPIYPDRDSVKATLELGKIEELKSGIKILCGSESTLSWIRSKSESLHVQLIDNDPINGGSVTNLGSLLIGRIFYENEIKIGPISAFSLEKALLFFVHRDIVLATPTYEVLTFNANEKRRRRRPGRRGPGRHGN